jgi:hypothetical protein
MHPTILSWNIQEFPKLVVKNNYFNCYLNHLFSDRAAVVISNEFKILRYQDPDHLTTFKLIFDYLNFEDSY